MADAQAAIPDRLTDMQRQVVSFPRDGGGRLFLRGLPGSGKTTALVARLAALFREGRRPYEILVLVPQRAQVDRYQRAMANLNGSPSRGGADILTYYSFARRAVALFWPLVAGDAGLAPDREGTFLTIETAQFFLWRIVEPLIREQGYFGDLAIRRERLLSQLIDNLNKSALVGFPHTDILSRLRSAWTGPAERLNSYWQAQDCAIRFRDYCLGRNLLDFSLVIEVFDRYLRHHPVYQRYFRARYRNIIVDNVEENVPVALDMISWAMEGAQSSVLAYNEGGGYRVFLGADAEGALALSGQCSEQLTAEPIDSHDCLIFAVAIRRALRLGSIDLEHPGHAHLAVADRGSGGRYWISMIQWAVERVVALVEEGVTPGDIALVAPYVSDVTRFSIEEELARQGLRLHLLRPSTAFRDDPSVRGLLVLSLLAHPEWEIAIQHENYTMPVEDAALALEQSLADLDPIRARHLAEAALPPGERALADLTGAGKLGEAARDLGRLWDRVGYQVREKYETLRVWLETYRLGGPESLDLFLSSLFRDLLSRPGFGFAGDTGRARVYGRLVESVTKFSAAVGGDTEMREGFVGEAYVQLILGGLASAEYLLDWPRHLDDDAVILAPAYTYLTRDIRSRYQVWLDLGSEGWWNRPNQPLTQPYVLSRHWPAGAPWRDVEEDRSKREALGRVVLGLAARCTDGIYLAYSELGINGGEEWGRLQSAILRALTSGGAGV